MELIPFGGPVPLIRRFGRPGLLGTISRSAVIAGTATMTSQAISRHSQQNAAEQEALAEQQQTVAAPTYAIPAAREAAPEPDLVERLSDLADLRASGVLTNEEFQAAKAKLLD